MALDFAGYLGQSFAGNTVQSYVLALLVLIAAAVAIKVFKTIVIRRLKKFAESTSTDLDDMLIAAVEAVGTPFYLAVSLYAAIQFLSVPEVVTAALGYAVLLASVYYVILTALRIIDYSMKKMLEGSDDGKPADPHVVDLLGKILKGAVWVVAVILLLSNMGINIDALIAGLGIGSIAIAFALQSILSDVFCSFSIYFDKPFKVGDNIVVGSDSGVVKKIGIKSTRVQSLQGPELVISNQDMVSSRIYNYRRMAKRRVTFNVGVTYETPPGKLKRIPDLVKASMDKLEFAEFQRCYFKSFGDFALVFEVIYFTSTNDYLKYIDTLHEINMGINDAFRKEGISMAYPTQTLYLNKSS
jgi:small-conductance mechanosensitive channel